MTTINVIDESTLVVVTGTKGPQGPKGEQGDAWPSLGVQQASEAARDAAQISATSASTSAALAEQSNLAAKTSEVAANASATQADISAQQASASANTAATKAAETATNANLVAQSATTIAALVNTTKDYSDSAATAAVTATTAAATATTALDNVNAVFDNFDDRYLGAKTSDPSRDNDGNPINIGALYYNSTTKEVKFYNGTTWESPTTSSISAATTATSQAALASVKADQAQASSVWANTSATNASASATSAAASDANASASATNAATSASTATTKASEASTSATNAASSATASAGSAIAAQTSASNAATSASNAATSATTAETQAANAATSATASANSATASANSAASALNIYGNTAVMNTAVSSASTSATNAATSATSAANSATQAAASASSAAALVLGSASNLPSIAPSLNLDFANSKQLDPRITFSRASTAAFYDGKTTVKAEENLLSSSSLSTGYVNISATLTANAAVAPDGTTTATKTVPTTANDRHISYKDGGIITLSSGQVVTYSAYFKPAGYNYAALSLSVAGSGANKTVVFDITSGVGRILTDGANLFSSMTFACTQPDTDGWCRASVTAVASTSFNLGIHISACNSLITQQGPMFAGDGVSGIYVWGMQVEQRAFPTAYTPTTTRPITNYIPVLQTAASNAARIDHDPVTGECKGLLIEEQRTNLLSYSSDFDSPAWAKTATTVLSNVVVAPDGTLSADKIIPSTSAASHYAANAITATTQQCTASVYVKLDGSAVNKVTLYPGGSATFAHFNLSALTTNNEANVTSSSILSVGNGWYRLQATWVSGTSVSVLRVYTSSGTNGADAVAGDGYSGIYLWGAQLEVGAFATSYIPTALTYSGRASTATYQGDEGLLATAAVNAPRYQRNAQGGKNLLLEGASTNLLPFSETFTSGWNNSATVIWRKTEVAPNGSISASYFSAATSAQSTQYIIAAATSYTLSAYVKQGTAATYQIILRNNTTATNNSATLTFATLTVSNSAGTAYTLTSVGNGWYRLTLSVSSGIAVGDTLLSYVATSYNKTGTDLFAVWGAQLETGSVATSYMPSVDTFTSRSSTATYFDSTGVLRTAPANAPRYGYGYDASRAKWVDQGLLVEASATNLLYYSDQFDTANWYKTGLGTVSQNVITSPDGTQNADKFIEALGVSTPRISQSISTSIGTAYTCSVYIKAAERSQVRIVAEGSAPKSAYFNIQTGTIVSQGTSAICQVTYAGNGWYRCSISYTAEQASSSIYIATADSGSVIASGDDTKGVYLWGAQFEIGSVATSYIPTTSAQVTRAADLATSVSGTRAADVYSSVQATRGADAASMTGTNFSSWYRGDEGSLYAEYIPNYASSGAPVSLDLNGSRSMLIYDGLASLAQTVYIGSTSVNIGNAVSGATARASVAYNLSSASGSLNGSAVASLNQSMTVPNRLCIGAENTNANIMNGTIKKIAYYPKRLSNSELQALTA